MALLIVKLSVAAAAYAFGIYCGIVIFRNLQSRQIVQSRSLAIGTIPAVALLVFLLLAEIAVYIQIVILQIIEASPLWLSISYNLVFPLLYGVAVAYVAACLSASVNIRRIVVIAVLASVPVLLVLWLAAQWQIFSVIY